MDSGRIRGLISLILFVVLAVLVMAVLPTRQQVVAVPAMCLIFILVFVLVIRNSPDRRQVSRVGPRSASVGLPLGFTGPDPQVVTVKIDEIEQEMRRVGLWQDKPLAPEQYQFSAAFAMDKMSYDQWLQFIFIPRVRTIVAENGEFPRSSSVGGQAIREFDTYPNAERLTSLLCEFDRMFRGSGA